MKKKKNDESKPRLFGGFGLPYGIVKSSVHIEINSNREAIIDGSSGILEYNECCIKISTGKMIVAFKGVVFLFVVCRIHLWSLKAI